MISSRNSGETGARALKGAAPEAGAMGRKEFLQQYILCAAQGAGERKLNVGGAVREAVAAWVSIELAAAPSEPPWTRTLERGPPAGLIPGDDVEVKYLNAETARVNWRSVDWRTVQAYRCWPPGLARERLWGE